jgi:hypothetical protein
MAAREAPLCVFLKVNEKDSADAMQARGIRAFPTFHLYLGGRKVDEMTGADQATLQAKVDKHKAAARAPAPVFAGAGLTVGAGAPSLSADELRAQRLRTLGLGAGAGGAGGGGGVVSIEQRRAFAAADPEAVKVLVEMGFTPAQAAKALTSGGNAGADIEAAVNWIAAQEEGPPAAPSSSAASSSSSSSSSSASSSSSSAASSAAAAAAGAIEVDDGGAGAATDGSDFGAEPMTAAETAEAEAAGADGADGADGGGGGARAPMTREQLEAKVREMRAKKAARIKEEARLAEIKRREDGRSKNEVADQVQALQRKAEAERIARAREFDAKEKIRVKLELMKDKAERESKLHGKASEETLAAIKLLKEGKPLPATQSPAEAVSGIVQGFCVQKLHGAGRAAADVLRKLLDNVAANPGEPKFRTVKLGNKVVQERVLGAQGGARLLTVCGFVKEDGDETTGGPVMRLHGDVDVALLRHAVKEIDDAITQGKL